MALRFISPAAKDDNLTYGNLGGWDCEPVMLAVIENCMFLDSRVGEFEAERNGETVKQQYKNAEFFQFADNSGGSINFTVDKDCDITGLNHDSRYDVTVDIRQTNYNGRKSFNARVVGFEERF